MEVSQHGDGAHHEACALLRVMEVTHRVEFAILIKLYRNIEVNDVVDPDILPLISRPFNSRRDHSCKSTLALAAADLTASSIVAS